jgi:transmembrane sensor
MSDEQPPGEAGPDGHWERAARSLAGEDTPEQGERFRAELAAHPGREALLSALDGALQPLRAPPAVDVEAALARARARRDTAPAPGAPPSARRRSPWRRALVPLAAALVLALGAGLLWRRGPAPGPAAARYATAAGDRRTIALADGSTAMLGPSTELWVDGSGVRSLRLRGDAYFRVRHDAARPFTVRTADAAVRDVGTAFTVRTGTAGSRVAVTEGVVAVRAAAGGPESVLRAGDRARVARGGGVNVERGAGLADDTAWTQGRLVFRDAPLAEVASEFHRWFGVTVVLGDSTLAKRRITATVHDGSADAALRVIAAAAGATVRVHGDTAVVTRMPR